MTKKKIENVFANETETARIIKEYESEYTRIVYQLMKEKLFVSFGLELSATAIKFQTNKTFALKGMTFAYYCPIDDSISINIEDPFFVKATSAEERYAKLIFILFHEAYHKTLMHTERRGSRDHNVFNIACDYEVHNMLYLYSELCKSENIIALTGYFNKIAGMLSQWNNTKYEPNTENGEICGLFSESLLDNVAEEIYQKIINTKQISQKSFQFSADQMTGNGGSSQSDTDNNNSQNQQNGQSGNGSQNGKNSGEESEVGGTAEVKTDEAKDQKGSSAKNKNNSENDQNNKNAGDEDDNCTVTVTETTYTMPDGRKHKQIDINWPDMSAKTEEQQKNEKNNRELRRQLMEQNMKAAAEKNKGNMSGKCETFLKKLFKIKIDWEKILKASLQTILTKSDYFTWAKPRTSMYATMDMYLPSIATDNEAYGTLIVARDESGSMTDDMVAKCGAIIADAKEHYKKIIVLKHDTEIQYEGEFEELTADVIKMICTRATCAGTSHKDVFDYITKYYKKNRYDENAVSCVILMTDCCSDIQQYQDDVPAEVPMIYLVPEDSMSYTTGIKGKIIPVAI